MWCWLQRIWPQACYCCSAWRWSAGAGTSPWDAPRDLPSPVQYSSLWRPEGEKKKEKKNKISFVAPINGDCEFTLNIRCHRTVGLLLPRLFSLGVGVAVVQGHRPAHFRVRSFPVRHACCSSLHCSTNTHTCAQPCHNSPQHLLHAGQSITQSCD